MSTSHVKMELFDKLKNKIKTKNKIKSYNICKVLITHEKYLRVLKMHQ